MTTCLLCGADIEDTSTTCPSCGEPVSVPTAQAGRTGVGDAGEGPEDPWGRSDGGDDVPPPGSGGGGALPPPGGGGPVPPPGGENYGGRPPHPSGLSSEVRGWAIGAHLGGLVAGGATAATLGFLGPLVVWLLKRDDHPFIDHHGKEALNFQLTVIVAIVVAAVLTIPVALIGVITLGVGIVIAGLVAVAAMVLWIAFPIMGAVKAANGEAFHYPVSIRFVR